jgi:hypothetical protein
MPCRGHQIEREDTEEIVDERFNPSEITDSSAALNSSETTL